MKKFKGIPENIDDQIIGLITRNPFSSARFRQVLITKKISPLYWGFLAFISPCEKKLNNSVPHLRLSPNSTEVLNEGDCVLIDKEGVLTVIWDSKAPINGLLLTEACDCRCIMCPQPPKPHDKNQLELCKSLLNIAKIRDNQTICITGGEPTLLKNSLFDFLSLLKKRCSKSPVMMLTNGKSFANFDFTKHFISVRPENFITCVSLHSDVDEIHDQIVGVEGSFFKTVSGIQNLARFREMIEIRVVISRFNAHRLESIANFFARNFPFISHCAFMGMEITGFASENYQYLWIDPYDYRQELYKAVRALSRADIDVSVYNVPLCLLEPKVWNFAKQSISGWKNDYLPVCDNCHSKSKCCGIFTTSGEHQSPLISPLSH